LKEDENGGLFLLEDLMQDREEKGPSFDFWRENGEK